MSGPPIQSVLNGPVRTFLYVILILYTLVCFRICSVDLKLVISKIIHLELEFIHSKLENVEFENNPFDQVNKATGTFFYAV